MPVLTLHHRLAEKPRDYTSVIRGGQLFTSGEETEYVRAMVVKYQHTPATHIVGVHWDNRFLQAQSGFRKVYISYQDGE